MDVTRLDVTRRPSRRDIARGIAASAMASIWPRPSFAQAAARIVVIGGGFGGASCARALRRIDPKLAVTLIEPNRIFTACPFSNEVIAGSFVYGLSGLFYGGCTVKDGAIEQTNFDTYNSMRIAEMPKVESIVMPSGGFWGGVGEPTICVAAPAVLNAYFAATGKRIRSVPLRDQNITFA